MDNLTVIADNCSDELLERLKNIKLPNVITIKLGNSLSFCYSLDYAITNFDMDDYIYFIEDDYWHNAGAKEILMEDLKIADYVTLYDHPDKYTSFKINPYVGRFGERTNVFLTEKSYWKITNSTTCTFATKVKILKEDYIVWKHVTKYTLPYDFMAFVILTKQKNFPLMKNKKYKVLFWKLYFNLQRLFESRRTLICPLPAKATHLDIDAVSPFFKIE